MPGPLAFAFGAVLFLAGFLAIAMLVGSLVILGAAAVVWIFGKD